MLTICLCLPALSAERETRRVYAIKVHDLALPSSVEYAPFQAILDDHPQIRYTRHTQLLLPNLERGSLLMAIASGIAPDILRVYHHEAKAWIRNGFFLPLDEYIYRDTDGNGRYTDGVDEVLWDPFLRMSQRMRDMIAEDGHIYILPRFQWIQFLVYRKDIFRDAGVDPEKRIETFDELMHVCRKLTDPHAKVSGARRAVGRHGIGISPGGWIWQGWLYACGGTSLVYLKTCPRCGTETEFSQNEETWACGKCEANLRTVRAKERAAFNSPAGRRALKLWQDLLWAPFVKCPHCREPIELGDAHAELTFPMTTDCPHCRRTVALASDRDVIRGCARPLIDDDFEWRDLWKNGEIAIVPYYTYEQLYDSTVDSRIFGLMPFPERGGASAYHYYGIYAGAKDREGGPDRIRVCAEFIKDVAAQFFVPKTDPRYLKYEKARVVRLVDQGFFNLCSYDELIAAGLEEYAHEVPAGSREMQRLLHDPNHYTLLPPSEGYSRVQQEVLGLVMLSGICHNRDYDVDEQLRKADDLANTQVFMKDEIVEGLMAKYRLPFIAFVIALAGYVTFLVRKVLARKGTAWATAGPERRLTPGRRATGVLLLLPAVLLISVWAYYPLVRGSIMAFQDVRVLGTSQLVGIENFVRVVSNPQFMTMVTATAIYVFALLSLGFFAPVILAILLSEIRRGSVMFRVIYYAPYLLSGPVVLFIWKVFYMPTPDGMLNELLGYLGIEPVRWLQDPSINKWALALPVIWAGTGNACLVYLAALKSVGEDSYEAAEIDGAGVWHKIRHITLPSLKPLLIINFVGALIGAFHGMGNVLILTGGAYETNVVGLQVFTEAFAYLRFGSSTALAWILGSFLVSFTIVQLGILKKVEFRRAE